MRFLHVGDLHIGKQLSGYPLLDDQEFALDQLLRIASARKVDALVIAGDIYDKSAPSADAVSLFDRFLTKVADAGLTCICIPGNHDSAERVAYAQCLLAHQQMHFSPVYDGQLTSVEIDCEGTPAVFWLMPFLNPGKVKPFFSEEKIGTSYTAAVGVALSTCELDQTKWNVLVAHQFVTAGGSDVERASDEVNLGGIDNVDVDVFDEFDYVALGHVHRPQRIGRDTVRYSGSLLKYSVSEANYPKSAVLVELGQKNALAKPGDGISFELVPIPCLYDLREIKGTLNELVSNEEGKYGNAEDYVHPILLDKTPQIDAMARLQRVYPRVLGLSYEYERVSSQGTAAADIDADGLDSLDAFALFGQFFAEQNGFEMTDRQRSIMEETMKGALLGASSGEVFDEEGSVE